MKAIIKETGQAVEVVSRFMPKKRNVPSRDWMCNLSNGTCINESELEYISDNIEGNRQRAEECVPNDLEEASDEYAEKHGFRVPYDGSDNFYDDVDVKASKEGFIAGAEWTMEQGVKGEVKDFCFVREVNYASAKIEFDTIPELKEGEEVIVQIQKR